MAQPTVIPALVPQSGNHMADDSLPETPHSRPRRMLVQMYSSKVQLHRSIRTDHITPTVLRMANFHQVEFLPIAETPIRSHRGPGQSHSMGLPLTHCTLAAQKRELRTLNKLVVVIFIIIPYNFVMNTLPTREIAIVMSIINCPRLICARLAYAPAQHQVFDRMIMA